MNIILNICPTCFEKTAMSSLNDSDEHTSPPATEGSLGVQVANSHFSNISASKGNNGCLKIRRRIKLLSIEANISITIL